MMSLDLSTSFFGRGRSAWRAAALVFVAGLLLVISQGCKSKHPAIAAERPTDPNEVWITPSLGEHLKFGTPEMMAVDGTLQVAAHVETDARRIARVGSPVSGRILALLVFEGQRVKAGAVLAMLHSTDLSDTQLALIKAVSQRGLADAAEKRAEQLVAADVIGRAELERRRAESLQAHTEVESCRTQLRGLGMTNAQIHLLETTRVISAEYPILSPRSGTVLKREITIGQVVQPADPAFTIADLSTVWIVANVPEEEAGQLKKDMEVLVRVPALLQQKITGHLSFISPIVDPATRTVEVHMDVDNPNGVLKPDELAGMTLTGRTDSKVTVPNAAIVRENNQDYVFVQAAPKKFVLRAVSLGDEENDRRVVVDGLGLSDQIVTEGAFQGGV
jgi:cobalt-zinc-cadmium efflux system membrane fusion protein